MIELTRHIEILLLENDCVIVPELGGFITHHQPAHYEEDEGVYLPPSRTVAFNPQLTMNDGLLVQSFMQAYHLDYTDALRMMNEEVDQLKKMLYQEGIVDMEGIGKLHCNIYGTYEFQPNANGILAPSLYALDTFPITMLPTVSAIIQETEDTVSPVYPTEEKKKIIRKFAAKLNAKYTPSKFESLSQLENDLMGCFLAMDTTLQEDSLAELTAAATVEVRRQRGELF